MFRMMFAIFRDLGGVGAILEGGLRCKIREKYHFSREVASAVASAMVLVAKARKAILAKMLRKVRKAPSNGSGDN